MAAARHCPVNGGREYALYALYSCLHPWMAAWAIETFRGEPWNEAKCAALDCAVRILNSEAVPVISEALHDTNERVRGHAAAVCFLSEFAGNWIPHITKQLFELLEDSSSYPRDYALLTLKKYGLISKEWYPTMGHPPSAPAQS
ncbi:hypothetical protein F183_A21360 [Bryobacterales bacterium F-183]|nr:hypothetical protein F183_A21360 [Bryobacterales bacterium F-183]